MSYLLRYLTFEVKKKMRNQRSEKLIHIGFVILRAKRTCYHGVLENLRSSVTMHNIFLTQ